MRYITIALSKGRLAKKALEIFDLHMLNMVPQI